MRQYLLARVEDQRRLAQLSESEEIKSLREDVSLAVMMFERRWNLAKSDTDFIAASPQLDKMLPTVERLKKSLLIVEKNLGTLLSHDVAMSMAQTLVQITLEELESLENWEPQLLQDVDWHADPFFRDTLSEYTSVMAIPITGDRLPMTWAIGLSPQAIHRYRTWRDRRAGGVGWRTAGGPDPRR